MSVRRTIFDSHNERELFVAIDSYWSSRGFALYPSLPFSNVFDNRQFELSPEEKSFLLKTSLDYTLCTRDGKPLVSVEFDGLCHGFSRRPQVEPARKGSGRG